MIAVCASGATLPQSFDQTIANVALPHMQGIFSASYDDGRNDTIDLTINGSGWQGWKARDLLNRPHARPRVGR